MDAVEPHALTPGAAAGLEGSRLLPGVPGRIVVTFTAVASRRGRGEVAQAFAQHAAVHGRRTRFQAEHVGEGWADVDVADRARVAEALTKVRTVQHQRVVEVV